MDYLIDEEAAQAQIDSFYEWYGIDPEETAGVAEEEGIVAVKVMQRRLLNTFRKGFLEVQITDGPEGTISVLQRLKHPLKDGTDMITYHEVTGRTKAAMKTSKNATDAQILYSALATIAKAKDGVKLFMQLRGVDLKVAETLGFLLLQA